MHNRKHLHDGCFREEHHRSPFGKVDFLDHAALRQFWPFSRIRAIQPCLHLACHGSAPCPARQHTPSAHQCPTFDTFAAVPSIAAEPSNTRSALDIVQMLQFGNLCAAFSILRAWGSCSCLKLTSHLQYCATAQTGPSGLESATQTPSLMCL